MALNRFLDDTKIIKKNDEKIEKVNYDDETQSNIPIEVNTVTEVKQKIKKNKKSETINNIVDNINIVDEIDEIDEIDDVKDISTNKENSITSFQTTHLINSPVMHNLVNDIILNNPSTEQYLDVVNQYKSNIDLPKSNIENVINDVYQTMPIYNFSKNKTTGELNIETKKSINDTIHDSKNSTINNHYIYNDGKILLNELNKKCENDIIKINLEIEIHIEMYKIENEEKQKSLINIKLTSFKEQLNYLKLRKKIIDTKISEK